MKITYVPFDEDKMKYQTDDPEALKQWTDDLRKIQYILWLIPYKSGIQFELESQGNSRVRTHPEQIYYAKCYNHKGLVLPHVVTFNVSKENLDKWTKIMSDLWVNGDMKKTCVELNKNLEDN